MNQVRQSVILSVLDKYIAQLLLVVTTAVMARLLTPAETGLYLVANSFLLLADNLRTLGVGVYIVQVGELRARTLRSAFTVTLMLSVAMMGAIMAGAGAIAGYYNAPEIAGLLRLAALGFLVVPFATPVVALLQRELDFRTLAVLNILSALANCGVTIALGTAGAGPESYVGGFLAAGVVLAAAAFVARPDPSMFVPSLAECRQIMRFGAVSSSVTVVNMAYEMLPRLLLGKLLGLGAVGLYSRAVTVCQIPERGIVSALQPVVLPALARRAREDGDLASAYLRGHMLMSAIQWPALVMLASLADPAVRLLLGAQWIEAVPLVRMIALAMMALAPAFLTFPVLVAAGRVRDTLWSTLVALPPSVALFAAANTIGLEAVAAATFLIAPFQMAVAFHFVRRAIGIGWGDMVTASRRSAVLAMATAAGPIAVLLAVGDGGRLGMAGTAMAVILGGLGWAIAMRLVRHPILEELAALGRAVASLSLRRRMTAVPE